MISNANSIAFTPDKTTLLQTEVSVSAAVCGDQRQLTNVIGGTPTGTLPCPLGITSENSIIMALRVPLGDPLGGALWGTPGGDPLCAYAAVI